MKRSEVVRKITEWRLANDIESGGAYPVVESFDGGSSKLLTILENMGMLPPAHEFKKLLFDGVDVQVYKSKEGVHHKIGDPGKVYSYETRNEWGPENA